MFDVIISGGTLVDGSGAAIRGLKETFRYSSPRSSNCSSYQGCRIRRFSDSKGIH